MLRFFIFYVSLWQSWTSLICPLKMPLEDGNRAGTRTEYCWPWNTPLNINYIRYLNSSVSHFYESHRILFIIEQTTLLQSNTKQVYFNSVVHPLMYATCFGLHLDHPQKCQYKSIKKEDKIKVYGVPFLQSLYFYNFKT